MLSCCNACRNQTRILNAITSRGQELGEKIFKNDDAFNGARIHCRLRCVERFGTLTDRCRAGSGTARRSIPIALIVSQDVLARLPKDRMIIVYSNGSENAAKAAVLLRLSGLDAHLLAGGYSAWHTRILNPDISAEELDGESLQVSAQRAYSCYFVGERSGLGAKRAQKSSEPFVPPVFTEEEELMAPPPAAGEESC